MLLSLCNRACLTASIVLVAAFASLNAQQSERRPVLLISIDGLHPGYILQADKHGLKVPVLRKFVAKGAHAVSVLNVSPTLTYPNHTTLVTGVLPSEHGVYSNTVFDPEGREQGAWNWYASQVKAPTLWQAAKAAGLVTASVMWPVTVNAPHIDYNVPEYWRNKRELDHYLMEAVSRPQGFLEEVQQTAGYFHSGEGDIVLDEKITRTAIAMIEKARPHLLTVHIVAFDHSQHGSGPLSAESKQDLEKIDSLVDRMIDAELKAHPNATIIVTSDHGFLPVTGRVKLNAALSEAGLIALGGADQKQVKSWKAFAWPSAGSASVLLKDSADRATEQRVDEILTTLAANPANGIRRVLKGKEAMAHHPLSGAAFVVDCQSGFAMGSQVSGPVVERLGRLTGTHGYLNEQPEMNSAFFVIGAGIPAGKNLGRIDMRHIAPTVARELAVPFTSATMEPLPLRDGVRRSAAPAGVIREQR